MEETTPQLSIMLTDSVSGGLSLCSTMSGTSVLGDHERLGVGFEQLGWKMHILDCFFTQVAGRLAGTVRRLGSAGTPGQSGYATWASPAWRLQCAGLPRWLGVCQQTRWKLPAC